MNQQRKNTAVTVHAQARGSVTDAKRSRASQRAISAALAALKSAGMPVEKVCVNGGQIEIHVQAIDGAPMAQNDGGLKDW